MRKIIALVMATIMLFGCSPKYSHHTYLPLDNIFQKKIAVLPFANETVDFDASPVFRYAVHNFLEYKGYQVMSTAQVDKLLHEEGINEGGQLTAFTPQELGEILKTDLLVYGTITEFNTKYALVYSSIQVEGEFKLLSASDGEKVWESTSGSYSNNFSRLFFVGNLIDLLMTLNVKEFITNNDFIKLFKDDYNHILSIGYLRQNVTASSAPANSSSTQLTIDPAAGRAIMQGAAAGVQAIRSGLNDKEGIIVIAIIFLTWTLLYAIFDNYNNYVVETITKGFDTFPDIKKATY